MENVLKYFEFSNFIKDNSSTFSGDICYSILNAQHFLIFEKNDDVFTLFVSKFKSEKEIGVSKPEILELLIENYDKSKPEHRVTIRRYFE